MYDDHVCYLEYIRLRLESNFKTFLKFYKCWVFLFHTKQHVQSDVAWLLRAFVSYQLIYLSVCVCLSDCLSVCLTVCLSDCLSV